MSGWAWFLTQWLPMLVLFALWQYNAERKRALRDELETVREAYCAEVGRRYQAQRQLQAVRLGEHLPVALIARAEARRKEVN